MDAALDAAELQAGDGADHLVVERVVGDDDQAAQQRRREDLGQRLAQRGVSRSLSFVAQLLDANVEIKCADMPEANRLLLQMLAVFSEHERQMIRARTKAALQAAKARGVELGKNGKVLAERNKKNAIDFAITIMPYITEAKCKGYHSYREICNYLNILNIKPLNNRSWYPTSIKRIINLVENNYN